MIINFFSFPIILLFHVFSVVIWIGGMFFSHFILKPATTTLPNILRPWFWGHIFNRFFSLIIVAVITILITGHCLLFILGGMKDVCHSIQIMAVTGDVMSLLFFYIWFFPYKDFREALKIEDLTAAVHHQSRIRHVILVNLVLGFLTIAVAVGGRC